jgi:MFS family permease
MRPAVNSADGRWLGALDSVKLRGAFAVSTAGDWIFKFAVPILVLRLTGSAIATAFAYVLEFIPYVAIGPLMGALADRFPRRQTMITCDAASCLLALGVVGLMQVPRPPIAGLFVTAFALACVRPLYFPAYQGFLVEVVKESDRPRFNSWTQLADGALSLAGPAMGAAIVATCGASVATLADAGSFATSALLIGSMASPRRPRSAAASPDKSRSLIRDLGDGVRAITASAPIRAGVILITAANLAAYAIEGNLVYFVLHLQHEMKVGLGLVFTAQGAGAIVGAGFAPKLLGRVRAGQLVALGLGLSLVAMTIPAIAPRFPSIIAGQAIEGTGSSLIVVSWFSVIQGLIPERTIGSFVSAVRAVGYLAVPLGAVLGAWVLTSSASVRSLFVCCACLQLLIVLATTRSPLIRLRLSAGQVGIPSLSMGDTTRTEGLDGDSPLAGVDVHRGAAQETDECQAGLPGKLNRERRRR